jgi:hypothetical protein
VSPSELVRPPPNLSATLRAMFPQWRPFARERPVPTRNGSSPPPSRARDLVGPAHEPEGWRVLRSAVGSDSEVPK